MIWKSRMVLADPVPLLTPLIWCCLLALDSVTSTPQWIHQSEVVTSRQYDNLEFVEFPVISMSNIVSSDLIDPMVQYPPVVAPKPGRPNRTWRIIGGEESTCIALRKHGKPFCGECKKWGHTKSSKRCEKYKRRVTKKKWGGCHTWARVMSLCTSFVYIFVYLSTLDTHTHFGYSHVEK